MGKEAVPYTAEAHSRRENPKKRIWKLKPPNHDWV